MSGLAGSTVGSLRGLSAGFRFQLVAMQGQADTYFALVAVPFFGLVFLSVMAYTGRTDLYSHAVIAPMLMALWTAALMFAGEMIAEDRENGRLESLVAAPVVFSLLVLGRLYACMLVALPAFAMSYLVAGVVFGYWMAVPHPVVFGAALLLTALATAAAATALSALFVAAPSARIVQNSLSFPMFLLGGVLIPGSMLPGWLEAATRVIYMSWGADLLRDATDPAPIDHAGVRLAMVALLGALVLGFGVASISRFLRRARSTGGLSRE
jgi:ABC-2 type transport system permease protein